MHTADLGRPELWTRLEQQLLKKVLDEKAVALETLLCFKRAGTDVILTYYAKREFFASLFSLPCLLLFAILTPFSKTSFNPRKHTEASKWLCEDGVY